MSISPQLGAARPRRGRRALLERARGGPEARHRHGAAPRPAAGRAGRACARTRAGPASSRGRPRGRAPARRAPMCSTRRASPAVWIENTSRQRSSTVAGSPGTNGCGSTRALQAPRPAAAGIGASGTTRYAGAAVVDRLGEARSGARARRAAARCRRRRTTSSPSRRKRSPSASTMPFSAIIRWPPKTRSVVDSWTPALAYT